MEVKFYKIFTNVGGIEFTSVTERTIEDYKKYILDQRAARIKMGFNTILHDAILTAIDNGNYELTKVESYGRVRS